MPTHCGVTNESVHSLARGQVIRMWRFAQEGSNDVFHIFSFKIVLYCIYFTLVTVVHTFHQF